MTSIVSWLHGIGVKAVLVMNVVLLILFVLSFLTICIWMLNWPVFILSGTSIVGFLIACAYASCCVMYYEPYLRWTERFKKVESPLAPNAALLPATSQRK